MMKSNLKNEEQIIHAVKEQNNGKLPDTAEGWYNVSEYFLVNSIDDVCRYCLIKVIEIEPYHCYALTDLAIMESEGYKNYKASEGYYKKILEKYPDDHDTLYNLAVDVYFEINELQKAKNLLKRALELAPDDAQYWSALGEAYQKMARFKKAKNGFRQSIKLKPNSSHTYYKFARLYTAMKELEKAKTLLKKALEITVNDSKPLKNSPFLTYMLELEKVYKELGDKKQARACNNLGFKPYLSAKKENDSIIIKAVKKKILAPR